MINTEAIEYLKEAQSHIDLEMGGNTQKVYDAIDLAIKALEERPTGEWEVWEDERWGKEYYFCSECNCQPYYEHSIYTLNFCPNCGARMKGEEE